MAGTKIEYFSIYGNGAMSKLLNSYLSEQGNVECTNFVVDDKLCVDKEFCGKPLIPWTHYVSVYPPDETALAVPIGYIGMNSVREEVINKILKAGYDIVGFVHGELLKHTGISIGRGCIIYDKSAIHAYSKIGDYVFIGSNVNIGHDCTIHDFTWINSGVSVGGGVTIKRGCVLGMGAVIASGVTLGEKTFVGANTLVTRDTKPGTVIASTGGVVISDNSTRYLKLIEAIK